MAGDAAERSMAVNSIASQEFGSDYTDLYHTQGGSLAAQFAPIGGWSASIEGAIERQYGVSVHATPAVGHYENAINALELRQTRGTLSLDRPTTLGLFGFEVQSHIDLSYIRFLGSGRDGYSTLGRASLNAKFEKPFGRQRFVARTIAASADMGNGFPPVQDLVFLGGPVSGPGYDFHQFASKNGVSQRFELQAPVPFYSFPLGRYGKTPASVTLAPFVNALWVDRTYSVRSGPYERSGWHPSVGVGVLSLFDLMRIDVARGLRNGRWTFSVDVSPDLWRIL
jgi:hypothetical protein